MRDPEHMTDNRIRWGIAATGGIAARFARSMPKTYGGVMVAVASRTEERARLFADEFDIPRAHGSYEALASDPEVDAVYVASPHSRHSSDCILYLEAGKHVLGEKPFTLNAAQARRVLAVARRNDRFVMEAMWSRFLPAYVALAELLADGRIGVPLLVEADFGFRRDIDPAHRLFDLAQGGGALLDLGIYPAQLSTLVLGSPERILASGNVGSTGVDEDVVAVLHHPAGAISVLKASIRTNQRCSARIAGTEGVIDIPAFMHCPHKLVVTTSAGSEVIDRRWEGDGLQSEIDEVHRCLTLGLRESPTMPLAETILLQEIMDQIRHQIGVVYPGESQ